MGAATTKRAGQRGKSIEEVVGYAVSHRTRVEILTVLNQGIYTTGELAEIIGEPLNKVGNHVRELLDAGSIEIADTKRSRNTLRHYYRAISTSFYSAGEVERMPWQERQVMAGMAIQSLVAELMAGLWAGKMLEDAMDWLTWDVFNLDEEGRRELYDEQEASWERLEEIKARAANRVAESGKETNPYLVSVLGFDRALKAPESSHSTKTD